MVAVLEPRIGPQRAQERLLERVLGAVRGRAGGRGTGRSRPVGLVEGLEGRDHYSLKRTPGRRCESVNLAVVGHVEWVEFVRVERVPQPGEIVHALETWEEAAGGGAVAAVQLAKLNGSAHLFTSLGNDEIGRRARQELEERGVTLHAAIASAPQRRAYTYVDERGERTITVLGPKLLPSGDDASLPWEELSRCEAVYFVSGDVAALRAARRSRVLVAAARDLGTLRLAEEEIDVLVGSAEDAGERYEPGDLEPPPRTVVTTVGRARRLGPARRPIPGSAASGPGRGRLRLRRLLRRRAHVCAGRGLLDGGGRPGRRPLRGGRFDRTRRLCRAAGRWGFPPLGVDRWGTVVYRGAKW